MYFIVCSSFYGHIDYQKSTTYSQDSCKIKGGLEQESEWQIVAKLCVPCADVHWNVKEG